MGEQGVHRLGGPVDQVEHALGEPGLEEQLRQPHRSQGRALGGLEDEGVACHHGQGEHPQRDHHGEVEGWDPRADPDRKAIEVLVDVARDGAERASLEERGSAAGEVHHLDSAPDLASRLVQRLAVMAGHDGRQVLEAGLQQLFVAEHEPHALHDRSARPGREGARRGLHGGVDLGRARERHLLDDLGGGRVVDGQRLPIRPPPLTSDQVRHHGSPSITILAWCSD